MNELRTLKDLETTQWDCESCAMEWGGFDNDKDYDAEDNQAIGKLEIKQEAIKWIKEFDRKEDTDESLVFKQENFRTDNYEIRRWIILFFNITDEDLI